MRKWKATGTVLAKARSARPRKILERQRRKMVRMVKNNPQTTTNDLQDHLAADGVTVHPSTIQRTLHKEKLYGRVMRKKPFLSTRHKPSRLRYAKANLNKPAVCFSFSPQMQQSVTQFLAIAVYLFKLSPFLSPHSPYFFNLSIQKNNSKKKGKRNWKKNSPCKL